MPEYQPAPRHSVDAWQREVARSQHNAERARERAVADARRRRIATRVGGLAGIAVAAGIIDLADHLLHGGLL